MSRTSPPGLFITGTNTGVGKTYFTAQLAAAWQRQGMAVGVYKPAASGCEKTATGDYLAADAISLWEAAGRPGTLAEVCPQCFEAPLAPHLAARAEGRQLDPYLLRRGIQVWQERSERVLVEGAGGFLSPLGDQEYVADLANDLGYPLVIVAANEIGVIHQVLQTLICASHYAGGLAVAAVVLSSVRPGSDEHDPSVLSNAEEIAARCPLVPVFTLGWQASLDQTPLAAALRDAGAGHCLRAWGQALCEPRRQLSARANEPLR